MSGPQFESTEEYITDNYSYEHERSNSDVSIFYDNVLSSV